MRRLSRRNKTSQGDPNVSKDSQARTPDSGGGEEKPHECEDLYRKLSPVVLPWIRSHASHEIDPEDLLCQTVFLVWKALGHVQNLSALPAYGVSVARRLLRHRHMVLRRLSRPNSPPEVRCLDPSLRNLEADELLSLCLDRLKDEELVLFRLIYIEGLRSKEVAGKLRISAQSVRARIHRLRLKLRNTVVQFEG